MDKLPVTLIGFVTLMVQPHKLLVIDFNTDSASLLVRSLVRKFPAAMVRLCGDLGTTTEAIGAERFDAIVLHRTEEVTGIELIRAIRALDANVPIVAVSGIDRTAAAMAAGANAFMLYDQWLNIGSVVRELIDELPDFRAGVERASKESIQS
jgi:DNA-binding NtrC family response regulator